MSVKKFFHDGEHCQRDLPIDAEWYRGLHTIRMTYAKGGADAPGRDFWLGTFYLTPNAPNAIFVEAWR